MTANFLPGVRSFKSLEPYLYPSLAQQTSQKALQQGRVSTQGAAFGRVAKSIKQARSYRKRKIPFILVLHETGSADVPDMTTAAAMVTAKGGPASHTVIISQQNSVPAICGVDIEQLPPGTLVTVDTKTKNIYNGALPIRPADLENPILQRALVQAKRFCPISIKMNTEDKKQIANAPDWVDGVGVYRSEHMSLERIFELRKLFLFQQDRAIIQKSLSVMYQHQKAVFKEALDASNGKPLRVRLLDLPSAEAFGGVNKKELSADLNISITDLNHLLKACTEVNPMMGTRGPRFDAVLGHRLYAMQMKAAFTAAAELQQDGCETKLELMTPLVDCKKVASFYKQMAANVHEDTFQQTDERVSYRYGLMLEVPSACRMAVDLAADADFLSFGTNDLTQCMMANSRDDTTEPNALYIRKGFLPYDPYGTLLPSVMDIMAESTQAVRDVYPNMDISLCGEQGGDPVSIQFAVQNNISISVSPTRAAKALLFAGHYAYANLVKEQKMQPLLPIDFGSAAPLNLSL